MPHSVAMGYRRALMHAVMHAVSHNRCPDPDVCVQREVCTMACAQDRRSVRCPHMQVAMQETAVRLSQRGRGAVLPFMHALRCEVSTVVDIHCQCSTWFQGNRGGIH